MSGILKVGGVSVVQDDSGTPTVQSGVTLQSGVTFPAGHTIQTKTYTRDFTSNQVYSVSLNTEPTAIVVDSETVQVTGISATQGNTLIIQASVGAIYSVNDATYQTNFGFIVDGQSYTTHGSFGNEGDWYVPVRPMMVFTVPANFTNKTISTAMHKQTSAPGSHALEVRSYPTYSTGIGTSGKFNISMVIQEIQA